MNGVPGARPPVQLPRLYASLVCAGVWTGAHPDTYTHHIRRGETSGLRITSMWPPARTRTPEGPPPSAPTSTRVVVAGPALARPPRAPAVRAPTFPDDTEAAEGKP